MNRLWRLAVFSLALAAPFYACAEPVLKGAKSDAGSIGRCQLPLATSAQAICAARHHLEKKSEACVGPVRFEYSAVLKNLSWVVRVTPKGGYSACTGDVLEIAQASGQLLRWERIKADDEGTGISPASHVAHTPPL